MFASDYFTSNEAERGANEQRDARRGLVGPAPVRNRAAFARTIRPSHFSCDTRSWLSHLSLW